MEVRFWGKEEWLGCVVILGLVALVLSRLDVNKDSEDWDEMERFGEAVG